MEFDLLNRLASQPVPEQLRLFCQAETNEARLYHGESKHGFFTINQRAQGEKRLHQRSYHNSALSTVLDLLFNGGYLGGDCYISQSSFSNHTRQAIHLSTLSMAWLDLDPYATDAPDVAKKLLEIDSQEGRVDFVLRYLEKRGISPPSMIIHSGRGLYLKWLFTQHIPRAALPRWNALQRELGGQCAELGMDPAALDACRVLRLVGTRNFKGEMTLVQVIWTLAGPDGKPRTYDFNELCDAVLPFTQAEVHAWKADMLPKMAIWDANRAKAKESVNKLIKRATDPAGELAGQTLWWDRLSDFRHLVQLRWPGSGIVAANSKQRNSFCWLTANALANTVPPATLWREICGTFREICPSFTETEIKSSASSVLRRVREKKSPYLLTNKRIRLELGITPDEERELLTFGGGRRRKKPINEGVMGFPKMQNLPHEEYLAETTRRRQEAAKRTADMKAQANAEQRATALQMHRDGLSTRKIADMIDVNQSTVVRWCKG